LHGGQLVLATIAVALATFMNVLDTSIANVAIPTISGNLGVSVDEGTWVITVFAAANAVSIPLTGWLTQRLGQIRLFVGAILMFVLASWLCGVAPTLPILLVSVFCKAPWPARSFRSRRPSCSGPGRRTNRRARSRSGP